MKGRDLRGQRFGWLTVIEFAPRVGTSRHHHFYCKCDCGKTTHPIPSYRLRSGNVTSCGCKSIKHGHASKGEDGWASPEYRSWDNMMKRCYNPKAKGYHNYGGRGIRVCKRWHDFRNFYHDLGPRPEGCTLDRLDSDKDYAPENCRWATRYEQDRNLRRNRPLTCNGRTQILADWASEWGVGSRWITQRLDKGYSMEEAEQFAKYKNSGR